MTLYIIRFQLTFPSIKLDRVRNRHFITEDHATKLFLHQLGIFSFDRPVLFFLASSQTPELHRHFFFLLFKTIWCQQLIRYNNLVELWKGIQHQIIEVYYKLDAISKFIWAENWSVCSQHISLFHLRILSVYNDFRLVSRRLKV